MNRQGNYTNLSLDKRNNLVIVLTPEGKEIKEDVLSKDSNNGLLELLEDHLCNGLEQVQPEEIGALTDSLIFSDDVDRDDFGTLTRCGRVWWFPNYMIIDPLEELYEKGQVIFEWGDGDVDANNEG